MNRHLIVGFAAGIAAVIALSGCGRGRSKGQEAIASEQTTTSNVIERPVTMVGCLVDEGATSQEGLARKSGTPPPPHFSLVDVSTPAPGDAVRSGVSYDLVADSDRLVDLQRFTNSRIELTGSIVASTGNGTPDAGAASGPVGAPPTDVRRVRVKDVRQLESTCGVAKKE